MTSFVFAELANTTKYGGMVVLYNLNLVFTEWRHCVSQNEVWRRGCYKTVFSGSDVTAFHRIGMRSNNVKMYYGKYIIAVDYILSLLRK